MNSQSVTLINKSNKKINIVLKSPEDATIPALDNGSIELEGGSTNNVACNDASSNLFVWDDTDNIVWQGLIPTKSKNSIEIFPEEKKVLFSGIEIPENFKNTTSFEKKQFNYTKFLMIVSILILLVVIGLWWISKKKK